MTQTREKPKPPTAAEYDAAEIAMALSLADIRPCRKCRWPVLDGYVCQTCGSNSP